MKKEKPRWLYSATISRIKDGDTICVDINLASCSQLREGLPEGDLIDLGFSVFLSRDLLPLFLAGAIAWKKEESIRLFGVNAPEKNTDAGKDTLRFVESVLAIGSIITLETIRVKTRTKQEKYGRYLGRVFLPDGRCLNDMLLEQGLAVQFFP